MDAKAQAGVEGILSLGILLFLFVLVGIVASNNSQLTSFLDDQWSGQISCEKTATVVSSLFAAGNRTKWKAVFDDNLSITPSQIIIKTKDRNSFCLHGADFNQNYNDINGFLEFSNIDGNIVVRKLG